MALCVRKLYSYEYKSNRVGFVGCSGLCYVHINSILVCTKVESVVYTKVEGGMVRTGRPRKDDEARSIPVTFRVTDSEYRRLQASAARRGQNLTDTVRRMLLARLNAEDASTREGRGSRAVAGPVGLVGS